MIEEKEILELLKVKGKFLHHREGQTLEFKEQYNFGGLAEYFRDFAAFANNKGGFLIFGVTDNPRTLVGLNAKSLESFNKIDPERITAYLLDIFTTSISWEQDVVVKSGKSFGVFKIYEADSKPVIAKKDEGKDQAIRNGEIYFRYGGRTQRIQSAELEHIINKRIENNNKEWIRRVNEIGGSGPEAAFVIRSEATLNTNTKGAFVIGHDLSKKLKFIREGQFKEKSGAAALRLIGDVIPVDTVEVEKVVKENLLNQYPLTARELHTAVKSILPHIKQNLIWSAIKDNDIKGNADYSAYNFRNKSQEVKCEKTGFVSNDIPVLYNQDAVDFIAKILSAS